MREQRATVPCSQCGTVADCTRFRKAMWCRACLCPDLPVPVPPLVRSHMGQAQLWATPFDGRNGYTGGVFYDDRGFLGALTDAMRKRGIPVEGHGGKWRGRRA